MSVTIPRVTCHYDSDLVTTSYAVTGLIELADAGEIKLNFRSADPTVHRPFGHWALWLHVAGRERESRVAVDFHDVTPYLCQHSLQACDYYYKSNFGPKTYDAAPAEHHHKLRPLGPYLPCRPTTERSLTRRWLGSAWNNFSRRLIRSRYRPPLKACFYEMKRDLQRRNRYLSRLKWSEYEVPPLAVDPATAPIVFNPSCWPEDEGEEIRALNAYRAELIVALREAFGPRFIGGFRRFGTAYPRYPQALETQSLKHHEFFKLFRATPLAIYTNGKFGCFSWSLAEVFATSKCIVSEPIPNDAGIPLDDRVGVAQCESVDVMVSTLERLTKNPDEVLERSQRAAKYYAERVRPQSRMRALLAEVLEHTPVAQPTS